eukprot:6077567-Pleurochrysis_carterae.AAC.4
MNGSPGKPVGNVHAMTRFQCVDQQSQVLNIGGSACLRLAQRSLEYPSSHFPWLTLKVIRSSITPAREGVSEV